MLENSVGLRVLVVDDECLIADTLALILNRKGFETTAVYSGEKAVEVAIALKPDVLISDVIMKGITGIEAAIRISATLPACRVILFSGNAATNDLLAGANRRDTISRCWPKRFIRRLCSTACPPPEKRLNANTKYLWICKGLAG